MRYIIAPVSDDLMHYGVDHLHSKTGRGSGRYAWGSGKNPRAAKREVYGSTKSAKKINTKKSRNDSGTFKTKKFDTPAKPTTKNKTSKQQVDPRGLSKTSKFSTANNMRVVNEEFKDMDNCSLCTFAMVAREKGYDVKAGGDLLKDDGRYNSDIVKWYKNANFDGLVDYYVYNNCGTKNDKKRLNTDYERYMLSTKKGNSSYGDLHVILCDADSSDYYGGHSVFYKIEKGKVMIYDSQSAKCMPYQQYMTSMEDQGIIMVPEVFMDCSQATLDMSLVDNESGHNVKETKTPDYNYSPANRNANIDKVVTSNYTPPYQTEKISYTPPYKQTTIKKVSDIVKNKINEAATKVKDVSVKTAKKASSKLSSAIDKCRKLVIK